MDVNNVTERYFQMIQNQKQTLQKAKKRQGQRPRDRKSREALYSGFMMALMGEKPHAKAGMIHTSFIPPAYLPCTTPMAELRHIKIGDLQLEMHHRGTYLSLRAITPPIRMTGIIILVEDDHNDAAMLHLYQQDEEDTREATEIINVGSIIILKEPYFKVMASGEYGLRVDHLSDITPVDEDDRRIPEAWRPRVIEVDCSAGSLKMKGNSAMAVGKYWQAITVYSNALLQVPTLEETKIIKRNRSLAFLKTKQFDAALLDTGFPDFGRNPSEKALFRAAEALYFLGQFKRCSEVLELLCLNFPENTKASSVLNRARCRCLEQNVGDYDFKVLQLEAKRLQPPHLDHATYIGPVEIRMTENKGRGLFVTKAIKAGDLLLCEKAFSHAYVSESNESNSKITLLMNLETNQAFMGGQSDLIRIIAQKLYRNPSSSPGFTTLYHGSYEAVSTSKVDGKPIVDTFLVERILSFNVFGCPLSSRITHEKVLANESNTSSKPTAYDSCGIWTQASYINHNCVSNARRSFIGDMMIVRAAQDLNPGSEITFWYQVPESNSLMSLQEKPNKWGFVCDCAICQDAKDTKATIKAERRKLLERMKKLCKNSTTLGIQTHVMERLLQTLNQTYSQPAANVPRLLLWDPQLLLTRIYMEQKNMKKSIESVGKVLNALGFIVVGADFSATNFRIIKWGLMLDHVVEVFLHAHTAFRIKEAEDDSRQAKEYARIAYKIVVGEDTSFE